MINAHPPPRPGEPPPASLATPGGRRVLVLCEDVLPYPGLPTSGAGLRAWGLAHGLASAGHDVTLLMSRQALDALDGARERRAELLPFTFDVARCDEAIGRWRPDIVVLQHWHLATRIQPSDTPLVIDLHGPLLLETLYQNHPHYEELAEQKIAALSRADFITCAGEEQRKYFYPWLILAGFDLREPVIAPVPVSLSPDLPPHEPEGEVTFVYGGLYLPWQNPLVALGVLVERLEAHGRGRLRFFGGAHPVQKLAAAEVEAIERQIAASDRVMAHGLTPRDRLLRAYRHAHVAFDVMARNPERELAFTTRTVEYLWCGLPVVYNNYAEIARYIDAYEAGWTVDPVDREAIAVVVDTILTDPDEVNRRAANAHRLVREQLTWDRTTGPLDAFCRAPVKRRPRPLKLRAVGNRPDPAALPREMTLLVDQIETLANQATASNKLLDALARQPPSPVSRALDPARRVAKAALGVDKRLTLPEHAATLAGDFAHRVTHGQTFTTEGGLLHRIDVLFATFARLNPSTLIFHLAPVTAAGFGDDLATVTASAARLRDNAFWSFVFPPVATAPGVEIGFWLESPDATPTTTVAVWSTTRPPPNSRQRRRAGQPVGGHLVHRVHTLPEEPSPDAPRPERLAEA